MRKLLLFFFLCLSAALHAQTVQLKKPMTPENLQHIKDDVLYCFYMPQELKVSYSTDDLFQAPIYPELPASLANVEVLKKKLKGDNSDAGTFIEISGIYSRLRMPEEAEAWRQKAIVIVLGVIAQYPDSAGAYVSLGDIYMGATRVDESIRCYRTALSLRPSYMVSSAMMANLYGMMGQTDSCKAIIDRRIRQLPDSLGVYLDLPLYYMYALMGKFMQSQEESARVLKMDLDSLTQMPVLDSYCRAHIKNPDAEYVWHVANQMMLSTVIPLRLSDTIQTAEFHLKPEEKAKLEVHRLYFEKCLADKNKTYEYYSNKMLGSIYTLLDQPKTAIPYLKRTIALKPKNRCSFADNSSEDFNNLVVEYEVLKDSAAIEKTLLEKIKFQPAVDPAVDDYTAITRFYISWNKLSAAAVYAKKAMDTDDKNAKALVDMALMEYLNGNNDKAIEYVNKAAKIDDQQWQLYVVYAAALLKKNDVQNAYEILKIGQKIHDTDTISGILDAYFVAK